MTLKPSGRKSRGPALHVRPFQESLCRVLLASWILQPQGIPARPSLFWPKSWNSPALGHVLLIPGSQACCGFCLTSYPWA